MNKLFLLTGFIPYLSFLSADAGSSPPPVPSCSISILPKADNLPYITADFIYWAFSQSGNEYAATGRPLYVPGTHNGFASLNSQGKIYAPDVEAKPGFKVAIGANLKNDSWDLYLDYTFLYGNESSSVSVSDNNTIWPLLNNTFIANQENSIFQSFLAENVYIPSSEGHLEFQYNNMHLELSKMIPLFCQMLINPHFGLQGAWIRQHFHATYKYATTSSYTAVGGQQLHFGQQFWGVGPVFGIDGTWQCFKHLGFFGTTSFAALWGNFDAVSKTFETNYLPDSPYKELNTIDMKFNPTTLSPVMEISLGLSSDWMLYDKYRIVYTLSWDTQVWFSHGQHQTFLPNSDLFVQGLTTGFRFDF